MDTSFVDFQHISHRTGSVGGAQDQNALNNPLGHEEGLDFFMQDRDAARLLNERVKNGGIMLSGKETDPHPLRTLQVGTYLYSVAIIHHYLAPVKRSNAFHKRKLFLTRSHLMCFFDSWMAMVCLLDAHHFAPGQNNQPHSSRVWEHANRL